MRKRSNTTSHRRQLLIRSLVYGTLAILIFAAAVSSGQVPGIVCLRDLAHIEGRPALMSGYGLVVGLNGTGDGVQIAHTDRSLLATLGHLGIDAHAVTVMTGQVAAVLVWAELRPGFDVGMAASARVTALNDATDVSGGRLLPLSLSSRDGRFRCVATGHVSQESTSQRVLAPASGLVEKALVCSQSVFMTDVPDRDFVIELRDLGDAQVALVAERINRTFGDIARAHSGCDIEVHLPIAYTDFAERASLVLQIAAMPVDDIVPALLVRHEDASASTE